jgi:hypothetical protein
MTHKYYVDTNGEYLELMYDGEAPSGSTPVPKREAEWFDFVDGAWVENQALHDERESKSNRDLRNNLLYAADKVVSNPLRWADLTAAKQTEWTTYRTDLLDVPQQDGFPHTIVWPTKPT